MKKDQMAYDLQANAMALDYTGDVSIDQGAMAATCIFSTNAVDRVGDIMEMSGIRTENHQRNPVVLWSHGKTFDKPIGRTMDPAGRYTVKIGDEVARQTTYFSQTLLEAEQIFSLICEGIISACSIGFETIKAQPLYGNGRKGGLHILESDLLEITWCAIPINPTAVNKAIHSLCCGRPLAQSIRSTLEPFAIRRNAWANGVTLEKCFDVRAMLLKSADFEESKHPRGQPGNAGQFGPGGSSGGSEAEKTDSSLPKEEPKAAARRADIISRSTPAKDQEYFHGTAVSNIDSILKDGIKPTDKTMGFQAAFAGGEGLAFSYGAGAAAVRGDKQIAMVVLKGGKDSGLLNPPGQSGAAYKAGTITPDQIDRIEVYDVNAKKGDKPIRVVRPGDTPEESGDIEDANDEPEEEEVDEEQAADEAAHDNAAMAGSKLPDKRPDTILGANVELRSEGDYVLSLATGESIHVDEYDGDLSSNLQKIIPNIKKLDDLHALNAELAEIDDSERIFYNGMKADTIDAEIDDKLFNEINAQAVKGNTPASILDLNDKLEADGDYRLVPDGSYMTQLIPVGDVASYFDDNEMKGAGLSNAIDAMPEGERADTAARWNEFFENADADTRLFKHTDGSWTAMNQTVLDDPEALAEYVTDQYDASDAEIVEWFNDLMAERGTDGRLVIGEDEDGDPIIEIEDGPETSKGLRFWLKK